MVDGSTGVLDLCSCGGWFNGQVIVRWLGQVGWSKVEERGKRREKGERKVKVVAGCG